MPTENVNKADNLIDVGEADQVSTEINLDNKGEPEKVEAPKEEKIEVEEVTDVPVQEDKREQKVEKKDEVQEYSEGVQKRIAKLTRKMREAERQKEEAVAYADAVNKQKNELEGRLSTLDKSYTSEFETRVKTNMVAAKQALKTAIESQDVEGQIAAQEQIANLTMDAARLNAMKAIKHAKLAIQKTKSEDTFTQLANDQQGGINVGTRFLEVGLPDHAKESSLKTKNSLNSDQCIKI